MLSPNTAKEIALWMSFGLGLFIPLKFAYDIYCHVFIPNMVTWLLVLVLDVTGLVIAYKEGNRRPLLQLGWVIAAVCIMLAIFIRQSTWHIGLIETSSAILCLLSVIIWRTVKTEAALFGLTLQTVAIYVSFIPQIIDYYHHPEPATWYIWFWSAVGCLFGIYASPKRDAPHVFIPWAAFTLNVFVLALVMR